jgi:hypothetical protein
MEQRVVGRCILSALILLVLFVPAIADSPKTGVLKQKILEISCLRVKMIDKIDQAIEMRTRFEQRLAELRDEIRSEQIRFEIRSHQEALQNSRIRYNLCLIQVLQAYVNRLNERIAYFQTGNERLRFLVYQIDDDLALITTLKDMEIEDLIDRINIAMDEFKPEIQKQIFNATDIRPVPIERVWSETSKTQLSSKFLENGRSNIF